MTWIFSSRSFFLQGTREPGLYIVDCLFSVLVIGSLVVFVWRGLLNKIISFFTSLTKSQLFEGLWVLLDLKLYPDNLVSSAWASLVSKIDSTLPFKSRKFLKQIRFFLLYSHMASCSSTWQQTHFVCLNTQKPLI